MNIQTNNWCNFVTKINVQIRIMRIFYIAIIIIFCSIQHVYATHNRAGEISIQQIDALTVRATIITYTKASSVQADRDTLEICWGDGFCEKVRRSNGGGFGVIIDVDTKMNIYTTLHSYAGIGTYKISMTDPNRNGGILNVSFPNSDAIPFHIETTYTLFNTNIVGYNNTPILLYPPIDDGCVGQKFIHNPGAYDIDGDSLAFKLIVPLQAVNQQVPNYMFPDKIDAGQDNMISINERTGDFTWMSPKKAGEYNIAMAIIEYRNGKPIDTLIRDMQILIKNCENKPPVITTKDELCVMAGNLVQFNVFGTDPDIPLQKVKLTAVGGPFSVKKNSAKFDVSPTFQNQTAIGKFTWQTSCEHISKEPYSVIFRALDNFKDTTQGLATLKTVRIKVVGPPPLDLKAKSTANQIELSWEKPYTCENADDKYFWAFSVWRKEDSNPFVKDTCNPGLVGKGYSEIAFKVLEEQNGRYYFKDTQVERGKTYCYRILAQFAKRTVSNQPYNFVESMPSDEVCVQLSRDVPLITNVSVEETSPTDGKILVKWLRPLVQDLDTLINKGPYKYQLRRSEGINTSNWVEIPTAKFEVLHFDQTIDSMYIDNGLNTNDKAFTYSISFYVNNETKPLGNSESASSIFLSIISTDEKNILNWQYKVPWSNTNFVIYKKNQNTGKFDSIGFTSNLTYSDTGLINGQQYCYKVKSIGAYSIDNTPKPLINYSEEKCGIPLDTLAPCTPTLTINNLCLDKNLSNDDFSNYLSWNNPNFSCLGKKDLSGYKVYYKKSKEASFELIFDQKNINDTTYRHILNKSISGCYAITAYDSLGNESKKSVDICVDNCPDYSLPNAFTPNGDNQNDLFKPYPFRFISRIEMNIFNRWGGLVFQTNDPNILWNGKDMNGNELASGVYYYTCKVFEQRVEGEIEKPEILKGYIQMIK